MGERRFRIHLRDVQMGAFDATATIQADSIEELEQNIKDAVTRLKLKSRAVPTSVSHEPTGRQQETDDSEILRAAGMAFMETCEVHKEPWGKPKSDAKGSQWHSHKVGEQWCNFSQVAKEAWQQELRNFDMSEFAVKDFLQRHFEGKSFEKMAEIQQAMAIARLRAGKS